MHSGNSAPADNFYNMTMGYRRDAALPCPYGYVVRAPTPDLPNNAEWKAMLKVVCPLIVSIVLQSPDKDKTNRLVRFEL
jgi:hypothetical protein